MQTSVILQATRKLVGEFRGTAPEQLNELSARLANMREYFDATALRIRHGNIAHALDPDFEIDNELQRAEQDIRELHRRVSQLRGNAERAPDSIVDHGAIDTLYYLARQAYTSAVQLQWEIGEHDVDFSPRKSGYVASSVEEVNQVLDRILAGK